MLAIDVGDNILEIDDGAASTDILHGRIRPEPIDVNDCAVGQELTDGPLHMDLPEGKAYLVTNLRSNLFTDSLNHLATVSKLTCKREAIRDLVVPVSIRPKELTPDFYSDFWLSYDPPFLNETVSNSYYSTFGALFIAYKSKISQSDKNL